MKIITNNAGVIAAVVMIIVAVLVYNALFKQTEFTPVTTQNANIRNEALQTLQALQGVSLDQTLFSSQSYLMLNDFSTTVPLQPVGRNNPFNSIGR